MRAKRCGHYCGQPYCGQPVIDGNSTYLKPLNSRYPTKDMTGIEFETVGVAVQRITDL